MARKRAVVDYFEQVDALRELSLGLPHGLAKTGLLEEAVRIADTHADETLGYYLRMDLIEAATFGGQAEVMLVAFGWCLALADREPEQFGGYQLLWRYKWVISNTPKFPQIPRAQIDAMLEDLGHRFQAFGVNAHAYLQRKRTLHLDLGEPLLALKTQRELRKLKADTLSDCNACEQHEQVRTHLRTGKLKLALRSAQPILTGKMACSTVPQRTIAMLLLPWVADRQIELALSHHTPNYKRMEKNPSYLEDCSDHLRLMVVTDNLKPAAKILERLMPFALQTNELLNRFHFYTAALMHLRRLEATMAKTVRLKLPLEFPRYDESNVYSPTALAEWFDNEARELADAFDRRNGNDACHESIVDNLALLKKIRPTPLPVPEKKKRS